MTTSWYNRLLLSYMPIFIIVPTILTIIFFLGAAELFKKETVRANEVFSRQAVQSLDYSLRAINELMNREIISNEFESFFSQSGNPYIIANDASRKLNQIKLLNPLIDSLYLYRISDQVVLSNLAMQQLEQYPDKEFIIQLMNDPSKSGWSDPRDVNTFTVSSQTVVTLARKIPLITGEKGIMLVNVSINSLRDLLKDMIGNEISFIHLYDSNGEFLLGTEVAHNNAMESKVNEKRVLSAISSEYTGWQIRSGMVGGSYLRTFAELSEIWIVMAFLTLIIGIGWLIIVSRRNYKPVKSIMQRISHISNESNMFKGEKEATDEFKVIESTLSDIIQKSDEYRKQQKEDIVYKRRHFYHELMEGSRDINLEEWTKEMNRFGLDPGFQILMVGLVEIDKFSWFNQNYSYKSQDLLRYALGNVIHELSVKHALTVWTEWFTNQQLGLLFQLKENAAEQDVEARIAGLCVELSQWVTDNLNFTITISIGSATNSLSEVYRSYDDALEAMKYKSVLGSGRIIGQKDIRSDSNGELYNELKLIRTIAQAYRLGEKEWEEQFRTLFDGVRTSLMSRDDLINLMNFLIYHLFREVMELSTDIQEVWKHETAPGLTEVLERFDTLDELYSDMNQLLVENARKMKEMRESKSNHFIIQDVKKFIEEFSDNPNMSLTLIGEQFHMSTSYLSRLFKDEFGENFTDYLAKVRIDHAKKLLRESTDSIHDIATRVGYTNYMSFNRVFKKVTEITPGEYRNQAGI